MKTLTEKEKETVEIMMRLGDRLELAIDTVIKDRPSELKRQNQLNSK